MLDHAEFGELRRVRLDVGITVDPRSGALGFTGQHSDAGDVEVRVEEVGVSGGHSLAVGAKALRHLVVVEGEIAGDRLDPWTALSQGASPRRSGGARRSRR